MMRPYNRLLRKNLMQFSCRNQTSRKSHHSDYKRHRTGRQAEKAQNRYV